LNIYDTIIIGAGASGLMLASILKQNKIALVDHNSKIGQKIKISGGGRCNITNAKVNVYNYDGDKEFIESILDRFSNKELLKFLDKNHLDYTIRDKQYYFCKRSADDIIDVFRKNIKHCELFLNTKVTNIIKNNLFIIESNNKNLKAKNIVIATGGLSYASVGASDIGHKIAKTFGHTVSKTYPALVGFTVQKDQFWFKSLSGISFEVTIKIENKIFKDAMLFTHKGVSGPAILNTSLYWKKGSITIDFLPNKDVESLLKLSKKQISSVLPLPKRFIKAFLENINLKDKVIATLSKEEIYKLSLIKNYTFSPAGTFGYTKAEATRGGVICDDINTLTMQSKKEKGLYFIGEVLDVTGELGGYNFQWAFSSAFVCAKALSE
jgi:predicted Rossmann fold flavoprotein